MCRCACFDDFIFFLYNLFPVCYNAFRHMFRDAGRDYSDARFVTGE